MGKPPISNMRPRTKQAKICTKYRKNWKIYMWVFNCLGRPVCFFGSTENFWNFATVFAFEGGFSFMFSWKRSPCFLYLIQIFGSRQRGLLHNGNHIARLVKSFHEILMRFFSYLIWSKNFAAFQFPSNWNNSFVASELPKFRGSPNIFLNRILFTFFSTPQN